MRVLFDQGVPAPLRRFLTSHAVSTAHELGWSRLTNGALLDAAEKEQFDVLVTTDSHLKNQQNFLTRRIGVVVLMTTNWPRIERAVALIVDAVDATTAGSFTEVIVP